MKQHFILLLVIFSFGTTNAQDTAKIFPGSTEIEFSKLRPHVTKLNMYFQQGEKRSEAGIYTDSFVVAIKDGKQVFARYAFLPSRKLFDTAYYDMKTLQSLTNHEVSASGAWTLAYNKDKVTGSYYDKRKDSTTIINQSMENLFFDGYLNDFLPRFLKLKDNYTAKIPLYSFGQKGVTWLIAHVAGSEKMNTPAGKPTEVWVLEITWPNNPVKMNLYVTKETRDILKMHMIGEKFSMTKDAI
jgi:hypothetical protein